MDCGKDKVKAFVMKNASPKMLEKIGKMFDDDDDDDEEWKNEKILMLDVENISFCAYSFCYFHFIGNPYKFWSDILDWDKKFDKKKLQKELYKNSMFKETPTICLYIFRRFPLFQ